ncbi:TPA: hypothetical protein ACIBH9_003312 [Salmonella enterica subsp. diarizonae serovar 61:l,v:z35]
MSIQEFDFTTCDLFAILDSLNYSCKDINGLTLANFRDGELSSISLSAIQSTRSAEISISQRVSTTTGLRCYLLLIAQHDDRIISEALNQDAEAQYKVNRYIRKMAEVTDTRTQSIKKCSQLMKKIIKEQQFKANSSFGQRFIKG